MKLKRSKLLVLIEAIGQVANLRGIKFAYAMSKNSKRIMDELESMAAGLEMTEKFKEYNKKRVELCKKHADKDENGDPKMRIVPGTKPPVEKFVIIEDKAEFDAEFETLKAEYEKEIADRDKDLEEYDESLNDETEFEFYKIKLSNVPKEITAGQLGGIIDLIDEKDSPDTKGTKKKEKKGSDDK